MIRLCKSPGYDGFGHQLMGMMSIMAYCKYFEKIEYFPVAHSGIFEHVSEQEKKDLKNYIHEIYRLAYGVVHEQEVTDKQIGCVEGDFNTGEIRKKYGSSPSENNTCFLDNVWSVKNIHKYIIDAQLESYIVNAYLPDPGFSKNNYNVVLHLRGGDAALRLNGTQSMPYVYCVNKYIQKINREQKNCLFHIHSNDKILVPKIKKQLDSINSPYVFFGSSTAILFILSQFIKADAFVAGDSSLSMCAAYCRPNQDTIYSLGTCFRRSDIRKLDEINLRAKQLISTLSRIQKINYNLIIFLQLRIKSAKRIVKRLLRVNT